MKTGEIPFEIWEWEKKLSSFASKSRLLSYIARGRCIWRDLLASASYVRNDVGGRAFVVVPCEIAKD